MTPHPRWPFIPTDHGCRRKIGWSSPSCSLNWEVGAIAGHQLRIGEPWIAGDPVTERAISRGANGPGGRRCRRRPRRLFERARFSLPRRHDRRHHRRLLVRRALRRRRRSTISPPPGDAARRPAFEPDRPPRPGSARALAAPRRPGTGVPSTSTAGRRNWWPAPPEPTLSSQVSARIPPAASPVDALDPNHRPARRSPRRESVQQGPSGAGE